MVRFHVHALALAAAIAPVSCGKVTDPDADQIDAAKQPIDAAIPIDAAHLSTPVAAITSLGIAGTPAQCVPMTPATGPGTIEYVASWQLDSIPFTTTTTTTIAGDTLPGTDTHTDGVAQCTLFATNGTETTASAPVTVTFKPRNAFTIDQASGTLDIIDLDSLALTVVGPVNANYLFGDLAWDAKNQKLFMVDGEGPKELYTIDTTTGSATEIGVHGAANMFALGFDGSGTLYGGLDGAAPPNSSLQLVNPTSAALTGIGTLSNSMDGIAFDTKRSMMVGITAGPGTLMNLNLTNGTATNLTTVSPGSTNNCGLTYDPFTDKFFVADFNGNLFRYDPANTTAPYQRTTLRNYPGLNFSALAIILPPPQ